MDMFMMTRVLTRIEFQLAVIDVRLLSISEDITKVQNVLNQHERILRRLDAHGYAYNPSDVFGQSQMNSSEAGLNQNRKPKKRGPPASVIELIIQSQKADKDKQGNNTGDSCSTNKPAASKPSSEDAVKDVSAAETLCRSARKRRNRANRNKNTQQSDVTVPSPDECSTESLNQNEDDVPPKSEEPEADIKVSEMNGPCVTDDKPSSPNDCEKPEQKATPESPQVKESDTLSDSSTAEMVDPVEQPPPKKSDKKNDCESQVKNAEKDSKKKTEPKKSEVKVKTDTPKVAEKGAVRCTGAPRKKDSPPSKFKMNKSKGKKSLAKLNHESYLLDDDAHLGNPNFILNDHNSDDDRVRTLVFDELSEFCHSKEIDSLIYFVSVRLSTSACRVKFVYFFVEYYLDSKENRDDINSVLPTLLSPRKSELELQNLIDGFYKCFLAKEDLLVEYPELWDHLATIMGHTMTSVNFDFSDLKQSCKSVLRTKTCEDILAGVLDTLDTCESSSWISCKWNSSKVKLTDFIAGKSVDKFIRFNRLEFLMKYAKSPLKTCIVTSLFEELRSQLLHVVRMGPCPFGPFRRVDYIVEDILGSGPYDHKLICPLTTAICEAIVLDREDKDHSDFPLVLHLMWHMDLLTRYTDSDPQLEAICLQTVAFLVRKMHLLTDLSATIMHNLSQTQRLRDDTN